MTEPSPRPLYIFRGHTAVVNNVTFIRHDEYFVSCDMEGWIFIWNIKTRRPVLKWKAHESSCMFVRVTDDNETLISQGRDNMIHIWQLPLSFNETTKPGLTHSIPYSAVNFCKISCYTNEHITFMCSPSFKSIALFNIFDLTNQKWLIQDAGDNEKLGACMAVELFGTPDHLFVLAGYESGSTALWEVTKNKSMLLWSQKEHNEPVLSLSMDSIRSVGISSAADNQLCKYSVETGDVIRKITVKKSGLDTLKIRNDNMILGTGGYDGRIRIFSYKTMKPLAVLSYHRDSVTSIDFGKENKSWLIAASDINISLWNIY
ncbi:WD40 repeat-like protein [Backusella circina FSU 941]|nr:WD40 repeat-like protein [Backusella circina FSU 941]